jgi:hypothetical protein
MGVVLGDRHLGEADHVFGARFELSPAGNLIAQALGFLREPLGARGILPEVGVVQVVLERVEARGLRRKVKDAPGAEESSSAGRWRVRGSLPFTSFRGSF